MSEQTLTRVVGRPFAKGRSGNPGGRPKELKEFQIACRELCPIALKAVAERLIDPATSASGLAALFTALTDRAYGKPTQNMEHAGPDGGPMQAMVTVSFRKPDAAPSAD